MKGWATGEAGVSVKRKIQERFKAEEPNSRQRSFQVKQFLRGHLELWQVNIERTEFARGKKVMILLLVKVLLGNMHKQFG